MSKSNLKAVWVYTFKSFGQVHTVEIEAELELIADRKIKKLISQGKVSPDAWQNCISCKKAFIEVDESK